MNAREFRLQLWLAGILAVMPATGVASPWMFVVIGTMVALTFYARIDYVRAIRARERDELEGPGQ